MLVLLYGIKRAVKLPISNQSKTVLIINSTLEVVNFFILSFLLNTWKSIGRGFFPQELVNSENFQEVRICASSTNNINLTALMIWYSK